MRRMLFALFLAATSFSGAVAMSACSEDDTTSPPQTQPDAATPGAVSIAFEGRVGSEPFRCTQAYTQLGTGKVTADLLDFRLYVHDVRLVTRDGRETPVTLTQDKKWQYENVALLDFEDKSGSCANGTVDTNTRVTGTVP